MNGMGVFILSLDGNLTFFAFTGKAVRLVLLRFCQYAVIVRG